MQLTIRTKSIELTPDVKEFVENKIGSLDKYFSGIISGRVDLEKVTEHHRNGPYFKASVDLKVPGPNLHAEANDVDVKSAIDAVKDELKTELKKYKESQDTQARRDGRALKKLSSLSPEARLNAEESGGGRTLNEGE